MKGKDATSQCYEYIIIGAGPAGLQLGYFFEKAGYDYLIVEAKKQAGAFFNKFPRHNILISNNKVHTGYDDYELNLRWDWNSLLCDDETFLFKKYSKEYFPDAGVYTTYLQDFAQRFDLKIQYETAIKQVSKEQHFSLVDQNDNIYTCQRLIVATGFAKPYIPPISGIELTENYVDVSVDPQDFINQDVMIIGKGNSGFETADNLIPTAAVIHIVSPTPLNMAWKTHFVGHLRAVNNNLLDTYQLKSQNAVLDATVCKIERRDEKLMVSLAYSHAKNEIENRFYDRIITCAGFRMDTSIFDDTCRPELMCHDRLPKLTSAWESVNVKGMYLAGTLTQSLDYKKATSGFIHGFRYNARSLFRILVQKYHNTSLPRTRISVTVDDIADHLVNRINVSSALWQQFGFLYDVLVFSEDEAYYYEELPEQYIHQSALGQHQNYLLVSLEFGKITGDPFNIERNPDPDYAEQSTFLHPVFRHFGGAQLLGELHLLEDLDAEWFKEDAHIKPLKQFLRQQFASLFDQKQEQELVTIEPENV